MAVLRCTCGNLTLLNSFSKLLPKNYLVPILKLELHTAPLILKNNEVVIRKKRDRFTVLKALASTVDVFQNKPDYRFFDDHVLLPKTLRRQKEALMSIKSGEKVANEIIKEYSHLFPFRVPDPSWPDRISEQPKEVSVECLSKLIKSGDDPSKAVEWYKILCSTGDMPLDVHNDMLDFVSFHALLETGEVPAAIESDADEESSSKSLWKEDNMAEKLFAQLLIDENVNGRTYEVYILGLLKHGQIARAFETYQQLLDKKLYGSLFLHNALLDNILNFSENEDERWDLAQHVVSGMRSNNIKPNVITFNELMKIASHKQLGGGTLCVQILREMKKIGITPSLGIYHHIIFADRKEELMEVNLLRAILWDLRSGKVDLTLKHPSDLKFFHIAMDLARYKRRRDLATQLMDFVRENNLEQMITSISSFYANYISTVARFSAIEDLYKEYRQLVPLFFIPRDWMYEQIFYAFRYHKNPKYVPEMFRDMISLRIPVTPRGMNSLFSAMATNIPEERAEEYLFVVKEAEKWMGVYNIEKSRDIDSVTIQVLCLNGKYTDALERVKECQIKKNVPTAEALFSVLKLSVEQRDSEGSLKILELMAKYKMKLTGEILELINNVASLSSKKNMIDTWFGIVDQPK